MRKSALSQAKRLCTYYLHIYNLVSNPGLWPEKFKGLPLSWQPPLFSGRFQRVKQCRIAVTQSYSLAMQFKGTQLGICSTRLGSDRYADFSFKARVCRGIGKGRQQRTFKCFKLQPSLMSVVWTTFIVYSIGRVLSPHDACWAQQNGDHLGLLGFF